MLGRWLLIFFLYLEVAVGSLCLSNAALSSRNLWLFIGPPLLKILPFVLQVKSNGGNVRSRLVSEFIVLIKLLPSKLNISIEMRLAVMFVLVSQLIKLSN